MGVIKNVAAFKKVGKNREYCALVGWFAFHATRKTLKFTEDLIR